ncbi:tyrosine-type recombinase/integrase [Streptomyces sp. NPDC003697]
MNRSARGGVRQIRLHDTRHTCGSLLAALDVHPRVAMQILRHSKIAVTMEAYTHAPSEATRRALRKLGKHLGKQDPKWLLYFAAVRHVKAPVGRSLLGL